MCPLMGNNSEGCDLSEGCVPSGGGEMSKGCDLSKGCAPLVGRGVTRARGVA